MAHDYDDTQRQQFAERARTEAVSDIAKEAGVATQTIYDWMRKFGVQRTSAGPSVPASLNGLSLADADSKDENAGYAGVSGALPPDKSRISYWRAENWGLSRSVEPLVDVVGFPDGRHGLVMPNYEARDPRREIHDLFVGIGTFAGVGQSPYDRDAVWSFADEEDPEDEKAGRVTWWRSAKHIEEDWQLRWMVAEMTGQDFDEIYESECDEQPSTDELWAAARAYHASTGNFALPVFHASGPRGEFRLGNPSLPTDVSGWPVGFAILSREQAETMRDETTWDQAYLDLKTPIDIRNDWREGLAVEGTVVVFPDDSDEEPEFVGTGHYRNDEIEDVSRTLLAETGTS